MSSSPPTSSLKRHAALTLIVGATLIYVAPLAGARGVPNGEDVFLHLAIADGLARGISEGHAYPRWLDQGNHRFGLPALIGYPPMSGYAVALARLATGDLMIAARAVLLIATLLGGLGFYFLARRFATPLIAGVGAAVYVLMPYHFVVYYQRYAFAELFCFLAMPFVLRFALDSLHRPTLRAVLGLAASFAVLAMSHIVIAYLFVLILGPALTWCSRPLTRPKAAMGLAAGLSLGAALGAVYLVPVAASRHLVHWAAQYSGAPETILGFAFAHDLLPERRFLLDAGFVAQLLCCSPLLLDTRRTRDVVVRVGALASVVAILLCLKLSLPVWTHLPGLAFVLYPFRIHAVLSLLGAVGVTWALARRRWSALVALVGVVIGLYVAQASAHSATLEDFDTEAEPFSGRVHLLWNQEHVPATVPTYRDRPPMASPFQLEGRGRVVVQGWTTQTRDLRVQVESEDAAVLVRTFFFPGWKATIDGSEVPIGADPSTGLIRVPLPRGVHHLHLEFADTPDRIAGMWLSIAALVLVAGLGAAGWARRWRLTRRA